MFSQKCQTLHLRNQIFTNGALYQHLRGLGLQSDGTTKMLPAVQYLRQYGRKPYRVWIAYDAMELRQCGRVYSRVTL